MIRHPPYRPVLPTRQLIIHDVLQRVGGYWSPLAATARVLEEIGELSAFLPFHPGEEGLQGLAQELADLWIITAATANLYLLPIVPPGFAPARYQANDDDYSAFRRLLRNAGHLAKAVNYYDGPKTPRSFSDWIPLSRSIPEIHDCLHEIATAQNIDLEIAVNRKLDLISIRDRDRFAPAHDPSTSPTLKAFESVRHTTPCPFAKAARLWGSPPWNPNITMKENILALTPSLISFAKATMHEGLDAYIIEMPADESIRSVEAIAETFCAVLHLIASCDPKENLCLDENIERRGWQFQFHNCRMFVSLHSPLYPESHVRYSRDGNFIMLQPESTFDRYGVSSRHKGARAKKLDIRSRFDPSCYPGDLIDKRIEAYLYLLPTSFTSEGRAVATIRWWKYLLTENPPEKRGEDAKRTSSKMRE